MIYASLAMLLITVIIQRSIIKDWKKASKSWQKTANDWKEISEAWEKNFYALKKASDD